jgi:hypothetical protein
MQYKAPHKRTSGLIKNHQPEMWAILKHPKYKNQFRLTNETGS